MTPDLARTRLKRHAIERVQTLESFAHRVDTQRDAFRDGGTTFSRVGAGDTARAFQGIGIESHGRLNRLRRSEAAPASPVERTRPSRRQPAVDELLIVWTPVKGSSHDQQDGSDDCAQMLSCSTDDDHRE